LGILINQAESTKSRSNWKY